MSEETRSTWIWKLCKLELENLLKDEQSKLQNQCYPAAEKEMD